MDFFIWMAGLYAQSLKISVGEAFQSWPLFIL